MPSLVGWEMCVRDRKRGSENSVIVWASTNAIKAERAIKITLLRRQKQLQLVAALLFIPSEAVLRFTRIAG